jgi:Zn-dependent protease
MISSKPFRTGLRLAGIPLYVDITFLVILPLTVYLIASQIPPLLGQADIGVTAIALGALCAVGLFTSVILHELGHSIVARWYGVRVRRIILWLLGGVAEFEEMPRQRGAEAVVGIAGPIVSFILGAALLIAYFAVKATAPITSTILGYLAGMNIMLGLFNLIPALPLDGGRILRSLLALGMPHYRATVISSRVAKVMAVLMGLAGIFLHSYSLILIAFFVFMASNRETEQSMAMDLLGSVRVRDLMNRSVIPQFLPIPPIHENATALEAFRVLGEAGAPWVGVINDYGQVTGIIGRSDLMRIVMGMPPAPQPTTDAPAQRVEVRRRDSWPFPNAG